MISKIVDWIRFQTKPLVIKAETRHCPYCKKAFKTNDPEVFTDKWSSTTVYMHLCTHYRNWAVVLVQRKYRDTLDGLVV